MSKEYTTLQFANFCVTLAKITKRDVNLVLLENYADILNALAENTLDLAYLGPLPYVIATQRNPHITPLVRFLDQTGETEYTCALVAFGSSELPPDITSVALTQPYSTCGFLVTESLLHHYDLSLESTPYTYSGNHEHAALAVIRGYASVAGVKTSIAREYANLGLNILLQSEPVPGFVLVGNSATLSSAELQHLRDELLKGAQTPGAVFTKKPEDAITKHGVIPVADEDYDGIRQMLHDHPVPELAL
ncbi:MAG: PhnD/SsuA/transferrin family substrate-binding protein [Desulfuromonadaceae bacterium]|jgi:phosphonate transport system substrate-binding protein|nr:PhnD/SsuA/transferrin family substrate-binding protein [Desulfuromonas sp.]MDY0184300.1 PhnD/SsuA/transferrin family substrate-binding protein [Desulfuromonadaceae bacterium]